MRCATIWALRYLDEMKPGSDYVSTVSYYYYIRLSICDLSRYVYMILTQHSLASLEQASTPRTAMLHGPLDPRLHNWPPSHIVLDHAQKVALRTLALPTLRLRIYAPAPVPETASATAKEASSAARAVLLSTIGIQVPIRVPQRALALQRTRPPRRAWGPWHARIVVRRPRRCGEEMAKGRWRAMLVVSIIRYSCLVAKRVAEEGRASGGCCVFVMAPARRTSAFRFSGLPADLFTTISRLVLQAAWVSRLPRASSHGQV
jgi:hypothetical protein